jgi:hypothetical protein
MRNTVLTEHVENLGLYDLSTEAMRAELCPVETACVFWNVDVARYDLHIEISGATPRAVTMRSRSGTEVYPLCRPISGRIALKPRVRRVRHKTARPDGVGRVGRSLAGVF